MNVHTSTEAETVARILGEAARRHFGAPATIEALSRQSGGASRQTWSFDAVVGGVRHALILRRDPPGHVIESSRRQEFDLLRAATAAGVPVPRVRWCGDDHSPLGSFFVMDFVEGETIGRKILRDADYATARERISANISER